MSDTQPATTYPTVQLYDQWTEAAEAKDMSTSEWMEAMIEAGRKKFRIDDVEPDEDKADIRRERAHLAQELEQTTDRLETLQHQLERTDRAAIQEYVQENPGVSDNEIIQHVLNTTTSRVIDHLTDLEGETFRVEDGGYYPLDGMDDSDAASSLSR